MSENLSGTATIVGGQGAMGRFFASRLGACGFQVRTLDKPLRPEEVSRLVPGSSLLLLAVPPDAVEDVLDSLSGDLPEQALLADLCSVKVDPMRQMLARHSGAVVGTHPLFGPEPDNGTPLRVALVRGRGEQAYERLHQLLLQAGLEPFPADAEEHDRAMAFIQGLNFATTAAYLASVSHDSSLEKYLTPSFQRRLAAARKMLTQDAELFEKLYEANPYSQEAVRCYRSYLGLAASGEMDLLLNRACWWWSGENNPGGGV